MLAFTEGSEKQVDFMEEIMENANRLKEIASILEENMNSFTL